MYLYTMTTKEAAQMWWADNHPFTNAELALKYYPNTHYSDIHDIHIDYIFKKEVAEKLQSSK